MSVPQRLLAAFFIGAGVMHFVKPRAYVAMMPPYLPRHRELVAASGVAEIVGGVAVVPRRTRSLAGLWLAGVLLLVFPANVHMAVNPEDVRGLDLERVPRWALWGRLALQPLLVAWAWRSTRP
ncbi:MAG: DoxX family protein [Solirubrobacterales bacterium]